MSICNFCAKGNNACYSLIENKLKYDSKTINITEALNIFQPSLIMKILKLTDGKICGTCLQQLENSYSFVQQFSMAQQQLGSAMSKTGERFILQKPPEHENNNASQQIKRKPKRTYKCEECSEIFLSFLQRKVHETKEHSNYNKNDANVCTYCCTIFANKETLQTHLKAKHDNQKYTCMICDKHYQLKGHFLQHTINVHQRVTLPYYCSLCPANANLYDTRSQLVLHFSNVHEEINTSTLPSTPTPTTPTDIDYDIDIEMNEEFLDEAFLNDFLDLEDFDFNFPHEPTEPYKCPKCQLPASTLNELLIHFAHVHDDAVLNCNNCEASFSKLTELMKHRRQHAKCAKAEHFNCDVCQKVFKTQAAISYHKKTHQTDEVAHKCPCCEKVFAVNSNLKQHLRNVHSQVKRHVCQLCDKEFTTLDHLKKHVLSVHQKDRKFICHICAKGFTQSAHLKQHLLIHIGGKSIKCGSCDKKFWRKIDLRKHMERRHHQ